ncbi:MAG: DUF2268 domain-containing putative Zn-dependent protease [Defluviitaleaceae bacterium]|nr:DUF2268 domain-containing putative Zn-dependent protease [Defluviitaleaceae bacterium]
MKINLRTASVSPMLQFLRDLKNGRAASAQITEILNHPDYDYEFRRYGAAKQPMINYFLNLNTIPDSKIPALRESRPTEVKDKHALWIAALSDPDRFEALLGKVQSFISPEVLDKISAMVLAGMPDDANIGTIDIVCTMSIGGSFGYVYDGAFHIDLLHLGAADENMQGLPLLLAHEVHHVAMMDYESAYINDFTLAQWFIHFFSGEGLAIKFCNNAQGTISKPIYDHIPANAGLDAFTMDYLNGKFEAAWRVFESTLSAIRAGKLNKDEVWTHLMSYWFNFHTDKQQADETPLLQQCLAYSFGNDLYGAIYDAFGKDVLFDCVRHPEKTLAYFRRTQAGKRINCGI